MIKYLAFAFRGLWKTLALKRWCVCP